MARNAEKAMTTLARWRAAQVQEAGGQRERRPYLASECNDLPQAEKWRLQIVREIAKKVAQIQNDDLGKYDEIFTKMNTNELKIRVPKSTKIERMGKYDRIQELCSCEDTPYNTGDQIQFDLPREFSYPDKIPNTYSTNLKYTYRGLDNNRDRKIINVTPSNCPVPINMEKKIHPQKDVFILKIGKKLETRDKKTDLEIELVTPKAPSDKRIIDNNHISQQCSTNTLKVKPSKSGKKKDRKKSKGKRSKSNVTSKKGKAKSAAKSTKNKK